MLPASISADHATLPATYERAKTALSECASKDECWQWADKAAALASYAKQAQDETLHAYARRIRARAIRRAGELLKQVEPGKTGPKPELREGDHPQLTRTQAAAEAGMSEHQRKTSLRVANLSDDEFERQVESANPPTATNLAEQGKQQHAKQRTQPPRRQFDAATYAISALERFVSEARRYDPEAVAKGLMDSETSHAAKLVAEADAWLDRFIVNLESKQ